MLCLDILGPHKQVEDVIAQIRSSLLYDSRGLWLVETRQIEEIRLLVEFVKDSARASLDVICREYGNRVVRETCSQFCSSGLVLDGSDTWGNYAARSVVSIDPKDSKDNCKGIRLIRTLSCPQ